MQSPVEQVKSRLEIVKVVSDYIKLEKAGVNYRARCPFHNEKTPSFFVSPSRQSYHCFGCGQGGDLIRFVETIEGLNFKEALHLLADQAGVRLGPVDYQAISRRERLHGLLTEAAGHYQRNLAVNSQAIDYLKKRGVKPESFNLFRLGYAKEEWRDLSERLKQSGYQDEEMLAAGVVVKKDGGGVYDRFRGRIIFPLADPSGRVVGFSGRVFPLEREASEKMGKYINSPQTELYDKSRVLYLYDQAKAAMRRADRCVLVEGQMDALLSHQAGFPETVAVSGTAFSPGHLELIKRLTNKLIVAFDSDEAGLSAGNRAVTLALDNDFEVRVVAGPAGQDPADIIATDPAEWGRLIAEAKHIIDFYIEAGKRKVADRRLLAKEIEKTVFPYLARLSSPLDRAHFVDEISRAVGLPASAIEASLARQKIPKPLRPIPTAASHAAAPSPSRAVWSLYFLAQTQATAVAAKIKSDLILWWGEDKFNAGLAGAEKVKAELILEVEISYSDFARADQIWAALYLRLREVELKSALNMLTEELRQAEAAGWKEKVDEYLMRCRDISKQINELTN